MKLAELCNNLGAGRKTKEDVINPKVGIKLLKTINDKVNNGETLMFIYTDKEIDKEEYLNSIKIEEENIPKVKIVYDIIK